MTRTDAHSTLAETWRAIKSENPAARARDVAEELGVSEGALVDARVGAGVHRLAPSGPDFARLMAALPDLGRVMTLTRNDAAVHETKGTAGEVAGAGAIGQVTGPLDLRLFYRNWRAGYLLEEETRSGLRRSFQIFDDAGGAVLKIYAMDETDMSAWARLAAEMGAGRAAPPAVFSSRAPAKARADDEIDLAALRAGWSALEHSHDFHKLLSKTGAAREQALRLAGPEFARRADEGAAQTMLEEAAAAELAIMCFVGNRGCVQIFSGPVRRIVEMGPWLNVLDPDFNLHLRRDRVASTWLVTKPTKLRGPITSLELFDADGEMVCQFFGARAPGATEREEWRALAHRAAEGRA
ncbi:hemin-degrading factor [Pikeienuella sp. HZG-20]|uniref:hemin-degrading factor n=1 Tax=Paludibacillus litoralis TaxID=3133267 RepID=UPI0030EE2618